MPVVFLTDQDHINAVGSQIIIGTLDATTSIVIVITAFVPGMVTVTSSVSRLG